MQSVPIATNVVSLNPTQARCTSIHYVIKFVSDLWKISGFLTVSSTNKTDRYDIAEILLKVSLITRNPYPIPHRQLHTEILF